MTQTLTKNRRSERPSEERQPLLRSITPKNFLSFGPDTQPINLGRLSVLIGPNGSGKSNLIEAICFLRAAPKDLQAVTREGGGVQEWVWKGDPKAHASVSATLTGQADGWVLRHSLEFASERQEFQLTQEIIQAIKPTGGRPDRIFHHEYINGRPIVEIGKRQVHASSIHYQLNASVLAQRRDPEQYSEITYLADQYGRIRTYRDWTFGQGMIFRRPQRADMRNDRLEEDLSNIGLFLSRLHKNPQATRRILDGLTDLYAGLDDFDVIPEGGYVQIFFTEGDYTIPAMRLSDGTLRHLCLLAILCDPAPPPLICIEEPELGLHPDILPKIADLLKEASKRTQLIVTTHSGILVDAMTDSPEAIMVCEKHRGQTQIERLDPAQMSVWLEKYRLGELWISGELGGNRW